jgi:signal transduction histidine kinase/CheY-like chemotaxis protein/HPt (histidine-containing phosphotransfer) domain-containing protein
VLTDTVYWLILGMPLVFFFYRIVMGMGLSATAVIMLKQSVNGIFNALVAVLCMSLVEHLFPKINPSGGFIIPFSRILFVTAVAFVFFPALIITIVFSRLQMRDVQENVQSMLTSMTGSAQASLRYWLDDDIRFVRDLGSWYPEYKDGMAMIGDVSERHFYALGVFHFSDDTGGPQELFSYGETPSLVYGTTRASFEEEESNGRGALVRVLEETETGLSSRIVILDPLYSESGLMGFSYGAVSGARIDSLLDGVTRSWTADAALVGADNRIIAQTGGAKTAVRSYLTGDYGVVYDVIGGIRLWTPSAEDNRSIMTRWNSAFYIREEVIHEETGLRILTAGGVAPYQERLHQWSLYILVTILIVVVVAVAIAERLSKRLLQPLDSLAEITKDLPRRVETEETVQWPNTRILEVAALVDHFRSMARSLTGTFAAIKEAMLKADTANRAKSDFLANMSHEFRTPMNSIIGLSNLLMERDFDDEAEEYLGYIRDSAHSLLDLINAVLDFSRIEAGQIELRHEPFSVRDLVRTVAGPLGVQARIKNLTLDWHVDEDAPDAVAGDPGKLMEMLNNLLGNAVNYTEEGNVNLTVHAFDHQEGRAVFTFRVQDTGPGIAPDRLEEIFEKFTRVSDGGDSAPKGTGLGLAIVKKLAEKMGGAVTVESEPGSGSSFTLTIPLGLTQSQLGENAATSVDNLGADHAPVEGLSILVAEDQTVNRVVVQEFLKKDDHRVVFAANGYEALQAVASQSFDLVLMDVQMPGMDGVEAIRRIRAHDGSEYDPLIPIIAVTAHAFADEQARIMDAGASGYVTKPINFDTLRKAMSESVQPSVFTREQRKELPDAAPREDSSIAHDVGASLSVWNRTAMMERMMGDESIAREILETFLEDVARFCDPFDVALDAGDLRGLERLAHSTKGAAGTLCADELQALAARVEALARTGDPAAIGQLRESWHAALERLVTALRQDNNM